MSSVVQLPTPPTIPNGVYRIRHWTRQDPHVYLTLRSDNVVEVARSTDSNYQHVRVIFLLQSPFGQSADQLWMQWKVSAVDIQNGTFRILSAATDGRLEVKDNGDGNPPYLGAGDTATVWTIERRGVAFM